MSTSQAGGDDGHDGHRLETATKTSSAIHQQLGQLGQANAEISRARTTSEARAGPPAAEGREGSFGELLLGNLLRDRRTGAFELQYGFKAGERVGAVIKSAQLIDRRQFRSTTSSG